LNIGIVPHDFKHLGPVSSVDLSSFVSYASVATRPDRAAGFGIPIFASQADVAQQVVVQPAQLLARPGVVNKPPKIRRKQAETVVRAASGYGAGRHDAPPPAPRSPVS